MRSYIPEFDVVSAQTLPAALKLLASSEGWSPLAGGTDLMVLLNAGKLQCRRLVSIREIAELREVKVSTDEVTIGGGVTFTTIRQHPILKTEFPLLSQAASWTGGIANQNRGTIGGNIVNASPAADSPPALLVYDAVVHLLSERGERTVPYSDFHTGYKRMQLEPDELLYQVRMPRKFGDWRQYGRKVGARKAQAISKVCLNAGALMDGLMFNDVRISIGSVAPIPLRCMKTEQVLIGRELCSEVITTAKRALRTEIMPIDDIRSTATYRAQVAENLLGEFLLGLQ